MNDVLKPLLDNELLTEETKQELSEAWETQLNEARNEITKELREEFTSRYEHDKGILVEAVERMVEDGMKAEIAEFRTDRKALTEKQVKLAEEIRQARIDSKKRLGEQMKVLEAFVLERLGKEIKEFEADRTQVREAKKQLAKQIRESRVAYQNKLAEQISTIEKFVLTQLSEEITEFKSDKAALVEQRVKMINEGKKKIDETRKQFIKRSANLVEQTIDDILTREITQLKEDIVASRKKHFGMQIFEAFADEFKVTFFNENNEIRGLRQKIAEGNKRFDEAKAILEKAHSIATESHKKQKLAEGRAERAVLMNELLSKLSGGQREVMAELLEGVPTMKLRESFKKYIPAVTNGTSNTAITRRGSKNVPLQENKRAITGDKQNKLIEEAQTANDAESGADIVEMRRLAGIR
jgi:hypothetical protein